MTRRLTRVVLVAAAGGVIGGLLALGGAVRAPAPAVTTARTIAPVPRPASWDDRADREPPPDGYIPAWQVRPPRPRDEPPPPVREPVAPASDVPLDPVRAVDGDRPPRPIPGVDPQGETP